MATQQANPQYDNFYTPQNQHFYSTFHYPRLDPHREEIRLLEIDRVGPGNHKLISRVPLTRASSFAAVSYYSGDPQHTSPLSIDGVFFNAFANLSLAIDNVIAFWNRTSPQRTLYLWTDQICINQSDPHEKAHQVAFMREIYRRADQVFVSMPMTTDIRPSIQWLQDLSNAQASQGSVAPLDANQEEMGYAPEDPLASREYPARVWDLMFDLMDHPWWQRAWVYQEFIVSSQVHFLFSEAISVEWGSMAPLLDRFLSFDVTSHVRNCKVQCDRSLKQQTYMKSYCCFFLPCDIWEASWDCFKFPSFMDVFGDPPRVDSDQVVNCIIVFWAGLLWLTFYILWLLGLVIGFLLCWTINCIPHCIPALSELRQPRANVEAMNAHIARVEGSVRSQSAFKFMVNSKNKWSGPLRLSDLMRHARNCQTSHPKDNVYAFLGLTLPEYNITPNYTAEYSICAVLTDAARAIITCEKRLDILADAGTAAENRRLAFGSDPLPSWVPDWTYEESQGQRDFIRNIGLPSDCRASGNTEPQVSFRPDEFGNSGRIMDVLGVHVADLLEAVQETYQPWRTFRISPNWTGTEVSTVSYAQAGDEVWVFYGANQPFVLRKERLDSCIILSVAMIRGESQSSQVMYGEAIERVQNGELQSDTISIC